MKFIVSDNTLYTYSSYILLQLDCNQDMALLSSHVPYIHGFLFMRYLKLHFYLTSPVTIE